MKRLAFALALLAPGLAAAADLRATVRDEQGRPAPDAVVLAVPEGGAARPAKPRPETIEQVDYEFVPRVKPVLVGSAVSFPNRDEVRHHVYSFSSAKRFDLPLYAGTPPKPVTFETAGVVIIGCNIHDWMVGYIYVAETPHYAVTGKDGVAVLAGLPPGRYAVRVWHPQLAAAEESTRRALDLPAQGAAEEWRIPLKPELRMRRAPLPGRGGRY